MSVRLFFAVLGIFAAYLALIPVLYLAIGYANLHFGWRLNFLAACFLLLVAAIVTVGNIHSRFKTGKNLPDNPSKDDGRRNSRSTQS